LCAYCRLAAVCPLADWPADLAVYDPAFAHQYMFGDRVIASPIYDVPYRAPGSGNTTLKTTYLPRLDGGARWASWDGRTVYPDRANGTVVSQSYGLGDIPLFVRGGILPLGTRHGSVGAAMADPVVWTVWPGAPNGTVTMYEDAGNDTTYETDGAWARSSATFAGDPTTAALVTLNISAAAVSAPFRGLLSERRHVLQLRGAGGRTPTGVTLDGAPVPKGEGHVPGWYVAAGPESLVEPVGAIVVATGPLPLSQGAVVEVEFD
jgi:hypothetical protein